MPDDARQRSRADETALRALQALPARALSMWTRAFQSLVWNHMASARMILGGKQEGGDGEKTVCALPGDLLLSPSPPRPNRSQGDGSLLDHKMKDVAVYSGAAADGSADAASASSIVVPMPGSATNALIRGNPLWRGIAEDALRRCDIEAGRERGMDGGASNVDPLSIFESPCTGLKCCRTRGDLRHLLCKPVGDLVPPEVVAAAADSGGHGGGRAAEVSGDTLAIRFRFQLPSGSYATCALRQLLHSDVVMG